MPWNVKRDGSVLEVHITVPVGSWGTLFEVVEQHLGHSLVGAIAHEHLPGAPPLVARSV